jgi:phospholipid-binding lipoprotein MlaA
MSCALPRLRAMWLCAAIFLCALGGCASTGNPSDPLEPLNRGIYKFNDGVDHLFVKPAAEIYRGLVPEIVRTGISNFFSNINDVIVALNNLLQGKFEQAVSDVVRIAINTTVGVLGAIDVATEIGLEKHNEDFGQTLGYWGLGSGPYLVLPILGPSSLRDSVGLFVDVKTDPKSYVDPVRDRNALYALYFVSRRSELLDASRLLEVAALDPYEFLRDAYLQRRRNLVYDGAAPDEDDIENKASPKPSGGSSRAPRPIAAIEGSAVESVLISGDRFPTPAETEARERAAQATAPARQLRSEPAVDSATNTRVVRVWVPASRN